MIRELAWRAVARIVTIPAVTDWLIARAQRTPYTPIPSRSGDGTYMGRFWLFNPYPNDGDKDGWERWEKSWRRHFPSVRVHHIMEPDSDDHLHDHPWNARTTVLRNWYREHRICTYSGGGRFVMDQAVKVREEFERSRGYTGRLMFGQYHRISEVAPGGVWTLFITWKKQGTWGFLVDGQKVPWRKYLGIKEHA